MRFYRHNSGQITRWRIAADDVPVVVIDPDGPDVNRLVALLGTANRGPISQVRAALREFANPTPPRMPEPDRIGSIVTAGCCHGDKRRRWIKGFDGNWWDENRVTYNAKDSDRSQPDDWDSLIDPAVER